MARVTNDTERVAELVTWGLIDSTWGVVNIATTLTFMFAINWQLALIVLAIIPVLLYAAVQFRKRILKQFRKVRKINSQDHRIYNENISGVRVVKALGREDGNLDEFKPETGRHVHSRLPRRLAERALPADRADHFRLCHRRHHLVQRRAGQIW